MLVTFFLPLLTLLATPSCPLPPLPGPGAHGFHQSDIHKGSTSWSLLASLINGVSNGKQSPQQAQCQGAKPLLLNVGESNLPYLWVPRVTEVALVRLGNFVSIKGLSWGRGGCLAGQARGVGAVGDLPCKYSVRGRGTG